MIDWIINLFIQGLESSISLVKLINPSMPSPLVHGLGYALFTFITLKVITFVWSFNVSNR